MKINFIDGELTWSGKWNVRLVQHRGMRIESMGTFIPKGSTDIEFKRDGKVQTNYDENHITVVRQPTKCRTLLILFHELCHWFVHLVFRHNHLSREKWHNRIDKYL